MPRSKKEIQTYYQTKVQEATSTSPQEMKRTALYQVNVSDKIGSLLDQPTKTQVADLSKYLEAVGKNEVIPSVFRNICKDVAAWAVQEPTSQPSSNTTTISTTISTTIPSFSPTPRNAYQSQSPVNSTPTSNPTSNTSSPLVVTTTSNVSNSTQSQLSRSNQPTQLQPRPQPTVPLVSPSQGSGKQSPNDLIESRKDALMELRGFSVENYKGHEHLIPEGVEYSSWVKEKFDNVKKTVLLEIGQLSASAQPNPLTQLYSWPTIKLTAQKVLRLKCAMCTAFALTSTFILCKDQNYRGPRVEIVSQPGHVFVIVGREGKSCAGGKIPSYSGNKKSWGSQFFVVDAWLGALGQRVIFGPSNGGTTYFMSLDELDCLWDSVMLEQG